MHLVVEIAVVLYPVAGRDVDDPLPARQRLHVRLQRGPGGLRVKQFAMARRQRHLDEKHLRAVLVRQADDRFDGRGKTLILPHGRFTAPHDKLSRLSYRQVARRYRVLSTGWFELRRLPMTWWPKYLLKRARQRPHWRVGDTALLSHPGCLLSCHRNYDTMLTDIISSIHSRRLTVLVTHWWEYFRGGKPDGRFIHFLHETADYLAKREDIRVVSFADLARGAVPLN